MAKKTYQVKTACPQCGCSAVSNLSEAEMRERFGDVPNVDLDCAECAARFTAKMEDVCPEWDEACRLNSS